MPKLVKFLRNPLGDEIFKNGFILRNYMGTMADFRRPLSNGFEYKIKKDVSIVVLGLQDIINKHEAGNEVHYKISNIYRYFFELQSCLRTLLR
jgi:hypothetical protein